MKLEIRETADGSRTIYLPDLDETYHSHHGAVQEALHVFIKNGLQQCEQNTIRIFELGFGTGLNAVLTQIEAMRSRKVIEYVGIEAFPVAVDVATQLKYEDKIGGEWKAAFEELHTLSWGVLHQLNAHFAFTKVPEKIQDFSVPEGSFDLIYFDAFGPRAQGEMWQMDVLEKMHKMLKSGGVLVTYCAMGQFKRDLKSLGFKVDALPGPPGKREMTRAEKL